MMTNAPKHKTARIISAETGGLIGGLLHREHENGGVTILFGGLKRRGRPLSQEDVLEIEAGKETHDGTS